MADTVSKINIKLGAQTADAENGLNRVETKVQKFGTQVQGAGGKVGGFLTQFGGKGLSALSAFGAKMATLATQTLGVVAALALMTLGVQGIKAAFTNLDRVANLADATEFSGQFILGLEHAADQAGSSTEAIGKSLQRFTRMLGEAEGGGKKAIAAFADLGLSVDELTQMSPEEAFLATAEAISRLPEAGEKAAKAYALFGRSGQELINVLSQGKGGIEALIEQSERIRGSVSSDDLKGVQDANDAVSRVWESLKGIAEQLAVTLAPAVEKLADEFTALFIDGREGFEAWSPAVAGFADVVVERITEFIHAARIGIVALKDLAGWLEKTFGAGTIENIGRSAAAVGVFISRITNLPFEAVNASIGDAASAGEKIGPVAARITEQTDELEESLDGVGDAAEKAKKQAEELAKAGDRLTSSLHTPFEEVSDELAHAQELMEQGVISWQTYMRAVAKADDALKGLTKTKDLEANSNVANADVRTNEGFRILYGNQPKNDSDKVVDAIKTGDAQIVATLRDVIRAAKEGGVTIVKRPLD